MDISTDPRLKCLNSQKDALFKTLATCPAPAARSTIMPKIISYTPPWLSRPSPGSQAFINIQNHDSNPSKRHSHLSSPSHEVVDQPYCGPHRVLARRGTEIFVVIGNQIRWTDLRMIKNDWEEQTYHAGSRSKLLDHQHEGQLPTYRVCQNDCSVPGVQTDLDRYWLHPSINRYGN